MINIGTRLRAAVTGRRIGAAAVLFFLAKGLVWLAVGISGYAAWAR